MEVEGDEIPKAEKGHWYEVEWWIAPNPETDNLHIKVEVDGKVLVDKDGNAGTGATTREKGQANAFCKPARYLELILKNPTLCGEIFQ